MPRRPTKKALFGEWKPTPRALAGKVHDLLMKLEPAFEAAPAWNGVGYKHQGSYSVLIAPYSDHVKLMIWRGIELDDPSGVLQGSGKNTRHLRIEAASDLKRKVLAGFLAQQKALYSAGMTPEEKPRTRRAGKMPDDVAGELDARGLRETFDARPPYQRRDYLAWITGAKREATRARRLEQMLEELEAGDVYMKMPWGSAKSAAKKSKKKAARKSAKKASKPRLLSGGNPQIPKGDGDAPVQAYIAAMPGWKRGVGEALDALIVRTVPKVQKAVRWNSPFYGVEGQGFFVGFHCFTRYIKVSFFKGSSLRPIPPVSSKDPEARYVHIHEDEALDEKLLARWMKQAAKLPGWSP